MEHDFLDRSDGRVALRPLAKGDPARLRALLNDLCLRLRSVIRAFAAERPLPAMFGRHPAAPLDGRPGTAPDGRPVFYPDALEGIDLLIADD